MQSRKSEATAADLTDAALAWAERLHDAEPERPYLLWVHYVGPHARYRLLRRFPERPQIDPQRASPSDRSDTEIAAVDEEIGRHLCDAIYLCATIDKDKANDTFNIGATDFTTFAEDYQAVLDAAGHGRRIIGLPAEPAIWTLRFLEALGISPLYKWVYETANKDSFVSVEKAQAALGWQPKFSTKQALVRNYEWYIANLEKFQNQSGVSLRVPWKQGAIGLAKMAF